MWFLNFCAPFIYGGSGYEQVIRYIIYITIIIEFLLYAFYIAKYKLTGRTSRPTQRPSSSRTNWRTRKTTRWTCTSFGRAGASRGSAR